MAQALERGRSYRIAEFALDHLFQSMTDLLDDESVNEILINRENDIWFERQGELHRYSGPLPARALKAAVRLFSTLSETMTLDQDGTLEGHWRHWRVTAVVPPVSRDETVLSLRRHALSARPVEGWVQRIGEGPDNPRLAASTTLQSLVLGRANILISGGTGSGKTTLLSSLMREIPSDQRVLTLEDTPELPRACENQVRLIARRGHSLQSLLRLSLRLRPDRIILGEVRGAEAFDLLQAMATGHGGSMGTIHAGHAEGALMRLETLVLMANLNWSLEAIRRQIAEWIRVVIHVMRDSQGRFIQEILQVDGFQSGAYVLRPLSIH